MATARNYTIYDYFNVVEICISLNYVQNWIIKIGNSIIIKS
jgi:hypothetical protein